MINGTNLRRIYFVMTILLVLLFMIPFIPLIISSFSAGWKWPEVFPHAVNFRAWEYIFSSSSGAMEAAWMSILIAFAVTFINLLLAIPAADALARTDFAGKRIVEGIVYAPLIIPPFVAVMGLHMTFIRLGLTESVIGVILAHISPTLPYMIRALMVSFATLGPQWEEQGRMLGAGRFKRLRYILFPHILPGIVAGASLSILVSMSQYLITFLVGGGQVITLPLILFPFMSGGDLGVGSAYSILFAGTALLLLWFMDAGLKRYYRNKLKMRI